MSGSAHGSLSVMAGKELRTDMASKRRDPAIDRAERSDVEALGRREEHG